MGYRPWQIWRSRFAPRPEMAAVWRCLGGLGLLAIALQLTASCTVGPDYVRPAALTPQSYKENKDWKIAEPKDRLVRGKWWDLFNDPQLSALEDQVNISNQNVAQAEAQFRQARALVQVARSAYFPTASIVPSWQRAFQSTPQSPSYSARPLFPSCRRIVGA